MVTLCTFFLAVVQLAAVPVPSAASAGNPFTEPVSGELRVVATIPDLADIAAEIGGERVTVKAIAKGTMNIHRVPIQPSVLVQMSRADLFLEMGLSLEHSFVPGLLMRARNRDIQPGEPGFVNCSVGWEAIQVPEKLDRGQAADLHPEGNPHFNLDPAAGRHLAGHVLAGLIAVDSQGSAYYEDRHAEYVKRLDAAHARWEEIGVRLRGQKLLSYHREFDYFALRYGMQIVGTMEAKPGVPPSPSDLARTVQRVKDEEVHVLVTAAWSNNKNLRFVADKTGARILELPTMVGGVAGATGWIEMMDRIHALLAEALGVDD